MKKLTAILLMMVWTLMMSAQTYSALWKQVETAQKKDQPKTAIAVLKKIEMKAAGEKSYGNLLAALVKEVNQQAEIGEDSLKTCKARLKAQQKRWSQSDGVMYLLSKIALGEGKVTIDSLVNSPDAALYTKQNKSAEYVPFITKGIDSKYFNNDLLHIIAFENGEYESLYRYYCSRVENSKDSKESVERKMACVAAAVMMEKKCCSKKVVDQCDSLINIYKDLAECKLLNDVRQHFWETLTLPEFHAILSPNRVNTQMPVTIVFDNVRNINTLNVTLTRCDKETKTFTLTLPKHEPWDVMKDTLQLGTLPLGKWEVTINDNANDNKSDKQYLFVTDLRVLELGMPHNQIKYIVVNDITGKEEKDATLIKAFADGKVSATLGADSVMPAYHAWSRYSYSKPAKKQQYLNIYTDRSIYRPGQTVHAALLRHDVMNGTEAHVTEGDTVKLVLVDVQGKQIDERSLITDEYGSAHIDFTLPKEGRTGQYNIRGEGKAYSTVSFNVEEYKRPTFDVTLAKPSDKYKEGDTLSVLGTAKTYSGVAVANAKVTYTVKQQMAWWWRRNNATTLRSDTIFTDADGHFSVQMPIPVIKNRYCSLYNIVAEATVLDNSGESHSASLSLPLLNRDTITVTTPVNPKDVFSVSGKEFSENGVTMQLGTTDKDVTVYYALFSADKVLEDSTMQFDNNTLTRTFYYKPEYGDGITVCLAWVKDGKMYSHSFTVKKPLPDNKLTMQWTSFRNKLVPGQKETWTLKVVSNGLNSFKSLKRAQMMAVLYDKSLDALKPLQWLLYDNRYISTPSSSWQTSIAGRDWFYGNGKVKTQNNTLRFSTFATDCRFNPYQSHRMFTMAHPRMLLSKSANMALDNVENNVVDSQSETDEIGLRSDFSETAFFMPQIECDAKGQFTMSFTLLESVTTWKFMSLAHDKQMRFGTLIDEAIAQKQLMLQAKMPRFMRVGDKGQITANVSNVTDKKQKVNVSMTILDAKTEQTRIYTQQSVTIQPNATVPVTFDLAPDSTMSDGIICKFMSSAKDYSDGEQHLLPILTEQVDKIDTTAFVVDPKRMILDALPQLAVPTSYNAITLSNALYANVMTAHLRDTLVSAANDNVLVQLLALQNQDGGFSWYKGMKSSKYITSAVVKTLVRMSKVCGVQNNTEYMLDNAFSYLGKEMQKEVEWQKEHKQNNLSSTALDWLYALTLAEKKGGTTETFFRKMLYEQTVKDDMQTKAVAGIVMNNNHEKKKAKEFAESIKQHTVYRADMGRYFDSYRAEYSWCDFKIPTQTMCIEALDDITPQDTTTITEMQKWLVQCKRTQSWDNAINAVNAVYALTLNKAQKPFMAAYTVNPEDYKDIIKVSRSLSEFHNVGDKVTVTITIVADRDYDFVTVTDNRAACMEPVNQLSGYHWGYYQETKDNKTVYHFNQLSKGTHTIETEYYIDRAGTYTLGTTTAKCEYAPEYRGYSPEKTIEIR